TETSAQNVTLSRQEVELTRARFLQGVTDNTEVVNAQDRLSKANDAQIRALYTLGLACANLARAVGGAERAYRKKAEGGSHEENLDVAGDRFTQCDRLPEYKRRFGRNA